MSIPNENPKARGLAYSLFLDAADEDYLVARWAAKVGLQHQFAWSSQQALEKYLKCALLLNDIRVANFGHGDLNKMYRKLKGVAERLVPDLLCPPSFFPVRFLSPTGRFEPTSHFLKRVEDNGTPENRYRSHGLFVDLFDLHKFDELVFQIRRVTVPLDFVFYPRYGATYREHLLAEPDYQPHSDFAPLRSTRDQMNGERTEAFRWRNFSFFEQGALDNGEFSAGTYSRNTHFVRFGQVDHIGADVLEWVLEMVRFNKADKESLKSFLEL